MSEHTKEPWSFGKYNKHCVVDNKGRLIIGDYYEDREKSEANARRIVACVNACAGYETEHLENLVMVGDTVLNRIKENVKELNLADKKREELLINLKKLVDINCPITGYPSYQELIKYWKFEEQEGRGIASDMINAINAIITCEAAS